MRRFGLIVTILTLLVSSFSAAASILSDTLEAVLESDDNFYTETQRQKFPVFGMFRQTYFVTGIPTNMRANKHNTDVRFQLSIAVRLARKDNVDILGTYTERAVWHLYDKSSPIVENVFNPGICVYWYNNPKCDFMFGLSHESNGYAYSESRSANTIYAGALYTVSQSLTLGTKVWIGYCEKLKTMPSWFKKRGYMEFWTTYKALDNRVRLTALVNPSNYFKNYNVECSASYRLSAKGTFLPALFVHYRHGYCETMVDYHIYQSFLRIGLALELKNGYNSSIH